ncbi:MAG: TIGR03067 domain-containing protein [Planctomycetes bacterium]|nr:TIGR03067 domain-containing protein [Planctomycetota bacterium]
MKTRLAIVTAMFLAVGLVWAGDAAKDKKAIQGTWIFTAGEKEGSLTFTGDKFKAVIGDESYKGTFKIDPSKDPPAIDMSVKEGKKYEGMTSLGIYKLEKNKLTWCANEPGRKERPKEFSETQGDMKFLLVVMQRKKK